MKCKISITNLIYFIDIDEFYHKMRSPWQRKFFLLPLSSSYLSLSLAPPSPSLSHTSISLSLFRLCFIYLLHNAFTNIPLEIHNMYYFSTYKVALLFDASSLISPFLWSRKGFILFFHYFICRVNDIGNPFAWWND